MMNIHLSKRKVQHTSSAKSPLNVWSDPYVDNQSCAIRRILSCNHRFIIQSFGTHAIGQTSCVGDSYTIIVLYTEMKLAKVLSIADAQPFNRAPHVILALPLVPTNPTQIHIYLIVVSRWQILGRSASQCGTTQSMCMPWFMNPRIHNNEGPTARWRGWNFQYWRSSEWKRHESPNFSTINEEPGHHDQ